MPQEIKKGFEEDVLMEYIKLQTGFTTDEECTEFIARFNLLQDALTGKNIIELGGYDSSEVSVEEAAEIAQELQNELETDSGSIEMCVLERHFE